MAKGALSVNGLSEFPSVDHTADHSDQEITLPRRRQNGVSFNPPAVPQATFRYVDGNGTEQSVVLPLRDNDPGAPTLLQDVNEFFRRTSWPRPYDVTRHTILHGDAVNLSAINDNSIHLVVTSPPYFNIKKYASDAKGRQLGHLEDYDDFLIELDKVWKECKRVLVPGGRICCIVGDVLVPRKVDGRHRVLPLPADIQSRSRSLGLDNLTPILWFKIGNRTNEAGGGSSGYYGKPYQPGAIVKNDHEHILFLRKQGGYRNVPMIQKALSDRKSVV